MNLTVNHIPKNWNQGCHKSFSEWFKFWIKSEKKIDDDYSLLNK